MVKLRCRCECAVGERERVPDKRCSYGETSLSKKHSWFWVQWVGCLMNSIGGGGLLSSVESEGHRETLKICLRLDAMLPYQRIYLFLPALACRNNNMHNIIANFNICESYLNWQLYKKGAHFSQRCKKTKTNHPKIPLLSHEPTASHWSWNNLQPLTQMHVHTSVPISYLHFKR